MYVFQRRNSERRTERSWSDVILTKRRDHRSWLTVLPPRRTRSFPVTLFLSLTPLSPPSSFPNSPALPALAPSRSSGRRTRSMESGLRAPLLRRLSALSGGRTLPTSSASRSSDSRSRYVQFAKLWENCDGTLEGILGNSALAFREREEEQLLVL